MNTFKPNPYAGDPSFAPPLAPQAGLSPVEAELAAVGVDDGLPDGAIAMMWLDEGEDDWDSLRDELDMFRRENDLGRD